MHGGAALDASSATPPGAEVIDLGSTDCISVSLRNAIDAGAVPGPHMLVANYAIGPTGGHADQDPYPPR